MNRKATEIDVQALPVPPLDFSRPANLQIAEALRHAIVSMQLVPGQRVSETEVAQVFGASRTPVREAFTALRNDGLIVTFPSRGTFVTKLCAQQVRGAQFLREAIEVSVIRRLAQGGPGPALADALTETLARQARAIEGSDRSAFQALDDRFHTQLVETTGLTRVRAVLDKERAMLARLRVLSLQQGDHMRRLHAEHGAILQAMLGRDVEAAAKAAQMHLRGVLDTLADLVAANRDYFDADAD